LPTIVPVPFPNVGGSDPALFGDPDFGLAVSARSKVKNAATTFALWLSTQKPGQQIVTDNLDEDPVIQGVSANWSALPLVNPSVQTSALQALSQKVAAATEPRQANISAALIQAIDDSASTTLAGKATPAKAAATLQSNSGQ
jgi:ABC-type glycerol-3-phosphate transport system substrate-binding protein